jgi:hypothetical protein
MIMENRWREILEKIEQGLLSPEEGARLMEDGRPAAAEAAGAAGSPPVDDEPPAEPEPDPRLDYWKRWWMVPLWVGISIFVLAAALMAWAHLQSRGFWFVCSFFPLGFGLLVMLLGWWSQNSRWVHVRIREKGGHRIAISLPIPTTLTKWFFRVFGKMIPGLRDQDQVLSSLPDLLDELGNTKEPLSVEVNDGDDEVQVYII